MSVINQVLTQLEQRGARPAFEHHLVRAVTPDARRNFAVPLLASGVVLLGVLAAWQLAPPARPGVAAGNIVRKQASVPLTAPAPAVSPTPPVSPAPPAANAVAAADLPVSSPHPLAAENPAPLPARVHAAASGSVRHKPAVHATGKREAPAAPIVAPPAAAAAAPANGNALPEKRVSPAQQAEAEFRKAAALVQQGRVSDALAGYEAALRLDAGHDAARQALVALLLEGRRAGEAERVLQEGLKTRPEHTGFAMLLARLQVERGAVEPATATLERSLPHADGQAEYQAFYAALLQRQNRHKEAITHYQIALQYVPDKGAWLTGYGISLQAIQRNDDARDAYRRALDSRTLGPELQAFVQQKLKSL